MTRPPVERLHPPASLMRWVNPIARPLVARGLLGEELLVLHFTGRRSGRRMDVPAGCRIIDGTWCVFTDGRWRYNFAGGREVEVTRGGRTRPMHAMLEGDADSVADVYASLVQQHGVRWAKRHLGIRVNVDREPTRAELHEMIARCGLSIVRLEEHPAS